MDAQGYISPEKVRQALRQLYRSDAEMNLKNALAQSLADDLKPVNENGRWKPNPLLILISLLACALAGIFVYFSIGGRP